jgi:hypothetical protein
MRWSLYHSPGYTLDPYLPPAGIIVVESIE